MSAPRYSFLIPLIVGCSQFMHQFDGVVIATALPSMARSMGEDPLRLNLAITSYLLSLAVFVPISGWIADRFGAKRVYLLAIAIFTLSSVLCGLSQSLAELVLARVAQGIGGAMMTPVGRVIVLKTAPRADFIKAMTYVTIPAALAPLLGPTVGGFIVTYWSWPWIFFINLPIGLCGLALVYFKIPDVPSEPPAPLDVVGFLLLAVSLACLVFGFEAMGRGLLPNALIVALLAGGAICAALYIAQSRHAAHPIIDLDLLKVDTFRASLTGGGLFYMGTTSMVFLLALLLQMGFGYSAFVAGLTTLAGAMGSLLTRFIVRSAIGALGFRRLLIVNGGVMGLFLVGCGFFQPSTPFAVIIIALFIGGLSRSSQFTAVQSLAYADMPRDRMSRATSFAAMMQQLAQSFGVGLAALVIHLSLSWSGKPDLVAADIAPGFFAIGLLSLASILVFTRLPPEAGAALGPKGSRGGQAER